MNAMSAIPYLNAARISTATPPLESQPIADATPARTDSVQIGTVPSDPPAVAASRAGSRPAAPGAPSRADSGQPTPAASSASAAVAPAVPTCLPLFDVAVSPAPPTFDANEAMKELGRSVFATEDSEKITEIKNRNLKEFDRVHIRWAAETRGPINETPLTDRAGTIYCGDAGGSVTAVDSISGRKKWEVPFPTTSVQNHDPQLALDEGKGTLYAGSYSGNVNAIDPVSGSVRWSTPVGQPVMLRPAISPQDGTVVVATNYGHLVTLAPGTGAVTVDLKLGDSFASPPVADPVTGNVYATPSGRTTEGTFVAVNPASGRRWSFMPGGESIGAPALHPTDGTVYCGKRNGSVYALDPSNGEARWEYKTGGDIFVSPVVDPAHSALYCAGRDGRLHGVDLATGQQKWAFAPGPSVSGYVERPPVIDEKTGQIYIAYSDGTVFGVNPDTGAMAWTCKVGANPSALQWDGDSGLLYAGARDKTFHAIDTATGQVKWRIETDGANMAPPCIVPGDGRRVLRQRGRDRHRPGEAGGLSQASRGHAVDLVHEHGDGRGGTRGHLHPRGGGLHRRRWRQDPETPLLLSRGDLPQPPPRAPDLPAEYGNPRCSAGGGRISLRVPFH